MNLDEQDEIIKATLLHSFRIKLLDVHVKVIKNGLSKHGVSLELPGNSFSSFCDFLRQRNTPIHDWDTFFDRYWSCFQEWVLFNTHICMADNLSNDDLEKYKKLPDPGPLPPDKDNHNSRASYSTCSESSTEDPYGPGVKPKDNDFLRKPSIVSLPTPPVYRGSPVPAPRRNRSNFNSARALRENSPRPNVTEIWKSGSVSESNQTDCEDRDRLSTIKLEEGEELYGQSNQRAPSIEEQGLYGGESVQDTRRNEASRDSDYISGGSQCYWETETKPETYDDLSSGPLNVKPVDKVDPPGDVYDLLPAGPAQPIAPKKAEEKHKKKKKSNPIFKR